MSENNDEQTKYLFWRIVTEVLIFAWLDRMADARINGRLARKNSPHQHKNPHKPGEVPTQVERGGGSKLQATDLGTAEPPSTAPSTVMAAGRIVDLLPTDIVYGRTPTSFNHPGTAEFRALAAGMKARCHNTERDAVDELMQELKQRGRRFVEKVGGVYREVLDEARNKNKCASALMRYAELLPKSPAQNAPELARAISAPMGTRPEVHTEHDETTEPCPAVGAGWTQKIVPRKKLSAGAPTADRYFFSPEGEKFRSMAAVDRHLRQNESQKTASGSAGMLYVEEALPKISSINVLLHRRKLLAYVTEIRIAAERRRRISEETEDDMPSKRPLEDDLAHNEYKGTALQHFAKSAKEMRMVDPENGMAVDLTRVGARGHHSLSALCVEDSPDENQTLSPVAAVDTVNGKPNLSMINIKDLPPHVKPLLRNQKKNPKRVIIPTRASTTEYIGSNKKVTNDG